MHFMEMVVATLWIFLKKFSKSPLCRYKGHSVVAFVIDPFATT